MILVNKVKRILLMNTFNWFFIKNQRSSSQIDKCFISSAICVCSPKLAAYILYYDTHCQYRWQQWWNKGIQITVTFPLSHYEWSVKEKKKENRCFLNIYLRTKEQVSGKSMSLSAASPQKSLIHVCLNFCKKRLWKWDSLCFNILI